jgi:DNA-binding NtrC family response regulator
MQPSIPGRRSPSPHPGVRREAPSLDAIASLVLDLREEGSKLELVERAIIDRAMSACAGNQSAAARRLGIERKALARRLARRRSEKRG